MESYSILLSNQISRHRKKHKFLSHPSLKRANLSHRCLAPASLYVSSGTGGSSILYLFFTLCFFVVLLLIDDMSVTLDFASLVAI
ncbi:hypothetical protein Bca4012_032354 [Brassica carinata]|uniref:(rape) hypothetical protein n=1 Tax=Brassica napus TaxID=3708 RepID=A0A816JRR1_BRANA|nr:unnamed protein product [Brassica napus]